MIYTCFAVSLAHYARMEQLLRQPVLFSVLPISKSKCWRRNTKIENNYTYKSIALSVPVVCPRLARLNSADHGWDHLAAWWAAAYMLSPLSRESHRRSIMVGHAFHHVSLPLTSFNQSCGSQTFLLYVCSYKRNYRCGSYEFVTSHHTQQNSQYILPKLIVIGRISRPKCWADIVLLCIGI